MTKIAFVLGSVSLLSCEKVRAAPERCFEYRTLEMAKRMYPRDESDPRWEKRREDARSRLSRHKLVLDPDRRDDSVDDPGEWCATLMERVRSARGALTRSQARGHYLCSDVLEAEGKYTEALSHLDVLDSVFENDPVFGIDSADDDFGTLARSSARSILLRDLENCRDFLQRGLPSALFGDWNVAKCLRQIHSPDSILLELDRSLESVVLGTYSQAPIPIQKSIRSHYPGLKEVTFAWTTVFGIPHILPPPPKDELRHTREEFIERYKSDGLYGQMYCLPNASDSLELTRERGSTEK
ncbi:MAG: hypothetical protein IPK50_01825 [Fibrobacterota bacterium]|nr:MAG: hypothetical protein IPK50_01825 [Fibrobacterota bacterium]